MVLPKIAWHGNFVSVQYPHRYVQKSIKNRLAMGVLFACPEIFSLKNENTSRDTIYLIVTLFTIIPCEILPVYPTFFQIIKFTNIFYIFAAINQNLSLAERFVNAPCSLLHVCIGFTKLPCGIYLWCCQRLPGMGVRTALS